MSCYITSGHQLGCTTSTGGVKKIWILGAEGDVASFDTNADNEITGMTASVSGSTFFEFELRRGINSMETGIQKNYENGSLFFETTITFVMTKLDNDMRNQILNLGTSDELRVVVEDNNDEQWYVGAVYGSTLSGTAGTGTALADRSGVELQILSQEPVPPYHLADDLANVWDGVIA